MRKTVFSILLLLTACSGSEAAEETVAAQEDAAPSDTPPLPERFPEPDVAGNAYLVPDMPDVERMRFGDTRAYRVEGKSGQTGYYAITPDNQLCFHFDDLPHNPCYVMTPVPDREGAFVLKAIGSETGVTITYDGPSRLDG